MELISKRPVIGKEKGDINIWSVAAVVIFSFLVSRACFMGETFPAGIALLTVLLSFYTLNFYLLPVMLIGLGTFYSSGISIWGDVGALCGCALVFLCTAKIRFAAWQKSIIAGSITVIARSVYYIAAGFTYRISMADLLLEGCFVAVLCGIFEIFLQLLEKKEPKSGIAGGLLALISAIMLVVSGTGFSWILLPAAMLVTLFAGYLLGTMEGLLAAFVSGVFLILSGEAFGAVFILALGGLTAGFSRGQNKIVAALCFAAVTMGAGTMDLSVNLALPFYGPLSAGAVLAFLPQKWVFRLDTALCAFLRCGTYKEKRKNAEAAAYLERVQKNFDDLSSLFVSQENNRILMSHQFKAMSRIMDHTIREISHKNKEGPARFTAEPAWAGYAKDRGISGDSYMWEELPGGKFAIVLSDGMGNGKTAATESSLAVTTVIKLLKAGLEVELVLKLLNSILLLNAENEIFSTIDLGIFNKKTGKMKFYKIGAATTFIKRKNSVETVKVSAMPMGIVDGLKIDYVTVHLNPGDQVIMISDGVTDSKREDLSMEWLQETIDEIKSRDPQTMCDLIMNRAVENYGLKEKDDLTVLSVRVS
ncbi:SpoIIE family protein phosphatase [Anaerovorax odorimutans]|uniref:SpoIIE family protein phosphatase n=1 Tax=Anaerovorax odorimutans TaxID=109327 RepID=A0ABT1RLV1_9FIRM|nr:SpoIIE family protein phosphatase [Anaerovorax odorimutans]MCQ4636169.1 SpoIIE family protein phosphatase [Anaerovorax odorimutans]